MKRDENFFQIDQIEQERARSGKSYLEFLRVPALKLRLLQRQLRQPTVVS